MAQLIRYAMNLNEAISALSTSAGSRASMPALLMTTRNPLCRPGWALLLPLSHRLPSFWGSKPISSALQRLQVQVLRTR